MTTLIGIDEKKASKLAEKLNTLLANYQVYYQNLRGFHWNIEGNSFFELHAKFEELYTEANVAVDTIAERILTLSHRPLHSFEEYLEASTISPSKNLTSATDTVNATIENLSSLIKLEREILEIASDAFDEGTVDLMSEYINNQEKLTWMLSAYLRTN